VPADVDRFECRVEPASGVIGAGETVRCTVIHLILIIIIIIIIVIVIVIIINVMVLLLLLIEID
jgi:hypothetical protein